MDSSTLNAAQAGFEEMLPHIQRIASYRFRYLDWEAREEAIQEATALAWRNHIRCQQQGKNPGASALAHYACLNVKGGRGVCGESSTDVSAVKAQKMGRSRVLNMGNVPAGNGSSEDSWDLSEALADRRAWEWPRERTRLKMDYRAFLDQAEVSGQEQRVFQLLSKGNGTSEVADRLDVSPPRICQVKNSLARKLRQFFGAGIACPSSRKAIPRSCVTPP